MDEITTRLAQQGYEPARIRSLLAADECSLAIEACRTYLDETPAHVPTRLLYAEVLYRSGQTEVATTQYRRVMALDPDNVVALKQLGDLAHEDGDDLAALSYYRRVQEIDPYTAGLSCSLPRRREPSKHALTLSRRAEAGSRTGAKTPELPFQTETLGDLYRAQGHARRAAQVYRAVLADGDNPRVREKLLEIEQPSGIKEE